MRAQTFFITALLVAIIIIGAKSQSGPFLTQSPDDIGAEFASAKRSVSYTDVSAFPESMRLLSDSLERKRLRFDAVYIVCGEDVKVGNFMAEGKDFGIDSEIYYMPSSSEKEIGGTGCSMSWEGLSLSPLPGEYCIFMNISRDESFVSDTFCGKVL